MLQLSTKSLLNTNLWEQGGIAKSLALVLMCSVCLNCEVFFKCFPFCFSQSWSILYCGVLPALCVYLLAVDIHLMSATQNETFCLMEIIFPYNINIYWVCISCRNGSTSVTFYCFSLEVSKSACNVLACVRGDFWDDGWITLTSSVTLVVQLYQQK